MLAEAQVAVVVAVVPVVATIPLQKNHHYTGLARET